MTITVLDAFSDPTLASDLHNFDLLFTLPDPPPINVILEPGFATPTVDPTGAAATEITLDVEWAHALAPKATIDLVEAQSYSEADILSITNYAVVNDIGNVITQSYGENETCDPVFIGDMDVLFNQATAQHQTLVAASGDTGAGVPSCTIANTFVQGVNFPASDPNTLAVGGTTLFANAAQQYAGELVWNTQQTANPPTADDSGGGVSAVFGVPGYQAGISGLAGRGVPDVAYDADPNSGVFVVCSSCGLGADALLLVGGTSVAAPQWAGIIADASTLKGTPLGFVNTSLYTFFHHHAALTHNVFLGNNTYSFTQSSVATTITGFSAEVPLWNAAIGLGTPRGDKIATTLG
jgi:subtilase family serine protease